MLNVRSANLLLILLTACAARSPSPTTASAAAPPASRAALEAKPIEWARRDPSTAVLSASTGRIQLVITPGWTNGEHFAWLVSNGTDVIRVYRSTSSEIGEIVDVAVRTIYPTVGNPLDKLSIGVVGSIHKPPPPPPDPGGFPGVYVEEVMHAAWGMNREQVQINGAVVGP